jgi:hypothetical protein
MDGSLLFLILRSSQAIPNPVWSGIKVKITTAVAETSS